MSRDLVLGIDGGGSKTLLALADRDGGVVALRRGPGLDPFSNPGWSDDLAALVADVHGEGLVHAVAGLSCHSEVKEVSQAQTAALRRLLPAPADVLNDVHVAFIGAFAGRAGVLALAGTGSMAWAGDGHGRHCRAGGWGDVIGDEGSAYWLGREALAETSRALDGRGGDAAFAEALLGTLGIAADDIIGWIYGLPNRRATVAGLAIMVDDLARGGQASAKRLLRSAADELCAQVEAAWAGLGLARAMVWSHAGGLFASATLLERMIERLGPPVAPRLPPVGGALIEAAQRAGWTVEPVWLARLATSLAHAIRSGGVPEQAKGGWTI